MAGTVLLRTRGLAMRFGGVAAVDGIDFSVEDGELRCLIGPNGAGKSTFFKCLIGQLAPTSGRVEFAGRDVTGAQPHEIARRGVAIKTQVPSLFDGLSAAEHLRLAARRRASRAEAARKVDEILALTGLADEAGKAVGRLAHGQRQWLELGVALACDPRLMLLDEPTAGMTRREVARTADLVREIGRERSVIVVEHDMQFIRMIAQTVTVLHQGRILAEDTMEAVTRNQKVRDVYLGRQAGGGAAC